MFVALVLFVVVIVAIGVIVRTFRRTPKDDLVRVSIHTLHWEPDTPGISFRRVVHVRRSVKELLRFVHGASGVVVHPLWADGELIPLSCVGGTTYFVYRVPGHEARWLACTDMLENGMPVHRLDIAQVEQVPAELKQHFAQ